MREGNNRVLVAPDSFKGSLAAGDVASAIAQGIQKTWPTSHTIVHPLADGGEGTVDVLLRYGFEGVDVVVHDHHGREITARVARRADVVVVESAQACPFTPGATPLDAVHASTRGVGEMISAALEFNPKRIYIAVGGTATTDGGVGMLMSLGANFLNEHSQPIADGGVGLGALDSVDLASLDPRLGKVELILLSDVDNPLLGPAGAAAVFSPQKGADASAVAVLEEGLERLTEVVNPGSGSAPGSGAGGGLGFAVLEIMGGRRSSGALELMALSEFDQELASADLVITGEGSFDDQSAAGKVPSAVIAAAVARGIPVAVVCGVDRRSAASRSEQPGLRVYQLVDIEPSIDRCIDNAHDLLVLVGEEIGRAS